ncbi:MAG TPA: NUDIX domain-containing protein [Candidatus Angelobacter sp.]|nr:NUDIX domain-containing protein [Candidatus Angelobacter sp.]
MHLVLHSSSRFAQLIARFGAIKLLAKTAQRRFPHAQSSHVAAICYRRRRTSIEFLLVNTSAGKWTFPKGRLEPGLSASEAAAREALEEAGVMGTIEPGHFDFYLDTKRIFGGYPSTEIRIAAYLLEVGSVSAPQEADRNPTWFNAEEAKKRLSERRLPKYSNHLARIIDRATSLVSRQKLQHRIEYTGQRRSAMVR